jgi:prepilin-type N-terminal cleavage/methylation domain-containing protein
MTSRRGFTLIELLVVLVIIAVLAALLFPALSRAREKARESTCLSYQKQLTVAMLMAVQDNKEQFPGKAGKPDEQLWRGEAMEQLGSEKVFDCPSTTKDGGVNEPDYGFNFSLYEAALGEMEESATVVMTADATNLLLQQRSDFDLQRHAKAFVASFVDGHAKAFRASDASIIYGDGDEGTLLSFGASNQTVTFSNATSATGDQATIYDGNAVVLVNGGGQDFTAKVTVQAPAGATAPEAGLRPGTSDLSLHKEKRRAFSLRCFTQAGEPVPTTYTFGEAPGSTVALTVIKFVPIPEE